jgi:DDE superfamily endonuclease
MTLWIGWMEAVRALRPACSRTRTFLWMVLALISLCCRADLAGVTSYVRVLGFDDRAYYRFLHLFHSKGLDLDKLTALWVRLCPKLFKPFHVGSRLVCIADGIKAPKEGRKMPAVKRLHQQSDSNSKPEYIMGHSFQAISLLVQGVDGDVAAVPLVSRIHEGLVFSNRDTRTLLDKLSALLCSIAKLWQYEGQSKSKGEGEAVLVADAYYGSGRFINQLLAQNHQLVTRAKGNAVAYLPPPQPDSRRRGRPRVYGKKVRLKDLARELSAFVSAPSPVYGENNVTIQYRCIDLLWRPAGHLVRFVIVHHPTRGTIFLLSTDLTLEPLEIILLYGYRFRIELGFRQAVHVLGAYAYHFWMSKMKPLRRWDGDQYLHRKTDPYRAAIKRKMIAFHLHVQLGCIAQGLLQHLSLNHSDEVWRCCHTWLRTMKMEQPPSELVAAYTLRSCLREFVFSSKIDPNLTNMLKTYRNPKIPFDTEDLAA